MPTDSMHDKSNKVTKHINLTYEYEANDTQKDDIENEYYANYHQ